MIKRVAKQKLVLTRVIICDQCGYTEEIEDSVFQAILDQRTEWWTPRKNPHGGLEHVCHNCLKGQG